MTESSGRIVVFGATGHLGRAITRLLSPCVPASPKTPQNPQNAATLEAKTDPGFSSPSLHHSTARPGGRGPSDSGRHGQRSGLELDETPLSPEESVDARWETFHAASPIWTPDELVLVARDPARLRALGDELGGTATMEVADLNDPLSLRGLLRPGDVVVSTAGPFQRVGTALLDAVVEAGAFYLDSSCEPAFVREVFEDYGPRAAASGATLVPGCGYMSLAGGLAGALALDEARGGPAARVDVAYFLGGGSVWRHATSGVLEAIAESFGRPGYAYRDRILDMDRPIVRDFTLMDEPRTALSVGGAEHHTLPRMHPSLHQVDVYVGVLGSLVTRLVAGAPRPVLVRGGRSVLRVMARRARRREHRPVRTARVAAFVYDGSGLPLGEVHLSGSDPRDFTAGIMAWCAGRALMGEFGEVPEPAGAFGPVEIFGLESLQVGCALAGISRLSG